MKRVTEWSSIRLSRVTHSREKTGLVDVQVGDRLVDQDQPDLARDHLAAALDQARDLGYF